jgi:flavin reductase (DIM6/NTAB) family NADH-FMN oxidoreductase RutF
MTDAVADQYRPVLGRFATGVTVVTVAADDLDYGMTVNAFSSVSLDPPLVQFCADLETRTHDLVADAEHYAVNVLTRDHEHLSNRFAGQQEEMDDPFHDIDVVREATGAPVFDDCLAYIDCSLEHSYDGGDHTIYVGRVEDLGVRNGDADPLTFYQGEYGTIAQE